MKTNFVSFISGRPGGEPYILGSAGGQVIKIPVSDRQFWKLLAELTDEAAQRGREAVQESD